MPLADQFTAEALAVRLAGRKASIKALLLDQTLAAGVGNIYADEALFRAGIHPARAGGRTRHSLLCRSNPGTSAPGRNTAHKHWRVGLLAR